MILDEYNYCGDCGCNAQIETWETRIGKRFLCKNCGSSGCFGDGVSKKPSLMCFSCEKQPQKYVTGLCEECHQIAMGTFNVT